MRNKKLYLFLSLVMVIAMLVSCGPQEAAKDAAKPEKTETSEKTDEKKPETQKDHPALKEGKKDGVLDLCLASEPASMDPAKNSSTDGAIMIQHAFEGLARWEDDGKGNAVIVPGAAEKWDVSEDKLTYTFHLRDGLKWSDGKPLVAGDFEYAWRRAVDPATGADYEYMLDMVAGYEEKDLQIKAVDDKIFEVKLSAPCPYFEEILAFATSFPVRKDIVEGNDQWATKPETYVSNGAYKMTEWTHNSFITYEKNPEYYAADRIKAEKIKFHLKDDANAIYAAYLSGELDFTDTTIPQEEKAGLLDVGALKVNPQVGIYFATFNVKKAPFDNPLVRKAFNLAIDRDYIVDKVAAQGQLPATGYVPAKVNDAKGVGSDDFRTVGGDYFKNGADEYKKNCEEARKLLAEAGYPDGKGFPAVEYLYNTNDGHKAIGEALQNMWQTELGVTVNLQNQDWAVFQTERQNGNFQIARHGWIADYNDPMTFIDMWMTGGGNNTAQYSNPKFDELVKKAKLEANIEERFKLLHQAEDIIMKDDCIAAPMYYYNMAFMQKPNVEGIYYTPIGYFFFYNATGF